jgi:DNA (cytosine-5)-methyltransferase 1
MNGRSKKQINNKLKAIDFFCGAGGVTFGFRKAGIKVLAGIDIDLNCKKTYEKNNKGTKFIHKDISTYSPKDLQQSLNLKVNDDHLIFVGCSPCQYYTIINTSKEKSQKSKLLLEDFKTFVAYFKPGYIFIENVPGLETKKGSPLNSFKSFLHSNGYNFKDDILNANDLGVPQNRKRYVLIASRLTNAIIFPKPKSNAQMTVRNFISTSDVLPKIVAGHKDSTLKLHTCSGLSALNLMRLRKTPLNGGTRLAWKNDPLLQLSCYKGKDDLFFDVYGRMFWDQPAPTITTKFYSITNGRFAHPEQNRGLSLREGAILQSFPLSYQFLNPAIATVARMIGNAVPPSMAKHIGAAIIKSHKNAPIQSQGKSS